MQIQTAPSRISWIDMAKGYGTILVIYAHLGVGTLWTWMYSFHLPLFFFLSGYVFSTKQNFGSFIFRKVKSIVIPYFCLGIPMIAFELFWNMASSGIPFTSADVLYRFKLLVFQQRFWTLWFMACLFFLNIGFYLLLKLCQKHWIVILMSTLLPILGLYYYRSGGTPLYWNVDTCAMAIPFFALGYLYKQNAHQVDDVITGKLKSIFLFLMFAFINIVSWRLSLDETGLGLEMFASNYGHPIFTYVAAFSGIFCVVIVSKWFTIEPIRYLGENSMLYYAWHQTIMIPIIHKLMELMGLNALMTYGTIGMVTYKWICLIGIIIILTICNWCIRKLKLSFFKKRHIT